jgi:hypothetical protein
MEAKILTFQAGARVQTDGNGPVFVQVIYLLNPGILAYWQTLREKLRLSFVVNSW